MQSRTPSCYSCCAYHRDTNRSMWPLLIIAWVIYMYHFVSGWGVAAAHKTFLVESTAME